MKRVVVTGLGLVSCIGNTQDEVIDSLKNKKSGIIKAPEYEEFSFRSLIHGKPKICLEDLIDRKILRFMGDGAAFNYIAMKNAIIDSGLEEKEISNEMTGLIMGSGGPSTRNFLEAFEITKSKGAKKIGPYMVPRTMSSTNSANLATPFQIKGVNYSISSACSTSSHCIGNACELIQLGKQKIIFAGGGEELHWTLSVLFDAMGALSSKYNETPEIASRAYDTNRDGFVIAGGGGTLILEDYDYAKARGAKIYAEITGYGATSDGYDMVQPSGDGAVRCMRQALKTVKGKIDYINTHGTSTPVGDIKELEAIKEVFENENPLLSSTKSLTGHSLGATGVQESIYCLLMMKNNFLTGSTNIENLDDKAKNYNIFTATRFVPKKGLELLFEAFQKDTHIALQIAGGDEKELNRLGLELKNGIFLLGRLSPADMAKQLATNKITVIPSIIEPYGIIVAEAICCGSPVVATNVGGIPEVIALAKKNLNSIEQGVFDDWVKLVDPEVAAIRAGIDILLKNYNGLEEYIKLVPKVRKQFSWSKRLKQYHNMLAES